MRPSENQKNVAFSLQGVYTLGRESLLPGGPAPDVRFKGANA